MKINKLMHQYYMDRLTTLPEIDPQMVSSRFALESDSKRHPIQWDDILGYIITIIYLFQLVVPTNWFSLGRCLSVFKLGF